MKTKTFKQDQVYYFKVASLISVSWEHGMPRCIAAEFPCYRSLQTNGQQEGNPEASSSTIQLQHSPNKAIRSPDKRNSSNSMIWQTKGGWQWKRHIALRNHCCLQVDITLSNAFTTSVLNLRRLFAVTVLWYSCPFHFWYSAEHVGLKKGWGFFVFFLRQHWLNNNLYKRHMEWNGMGELGTGKGSV